MLCNNGTDEMAIPLALSRARNERRVTPFLLLSLDSSRRFRDDGWRQFGRSLVLHELTPLSLAREWLADVYRLGVRFSTVLMGWLSSCVRMDEIDHQKG